MRTIIKVLSFFFSFTSAANALDPRLGPFDKPEPRELIYNSAHEPFDLAGALNSTTTDQLSCEQFENTLWIPHRTEETSGDCIRYYPYGLNETDNPVTLIYFNGDVILRNRKDERFIAPSYKPITPYSLQYDMAEWSVQAQTPAILIARPGIYGSSGDHNMRRYPREIELMNAALDQLKRRYAIKKFILAGQSGGGHIAASLLNQRTDIQAAFIASGLLSVAKTMAYKANQPKIKGPYYPDPERYYDPADHVSTISTTPPPDVFILSDVKDRVVPFVTQLDYVRKLRETGLRPFHIITTGEGRQHHLLFRKARLAAVMYQRGTSPRDIVKTLADPETNQPQKPTPEKKH